MNITKGNIIFNKTSDIFGCAYNFIYFINFYWNTSGYFGNWKIDESKG